VDFREGPALERLDALLADDAFDFAFVDAHSNTDSSNKTLLKSQALYKVI
jgi:predicted O-methyltransferase YrrM